MELNGALSNRESPARLKNVAAYHSRLVARATVTPASARPVPPGPSPVLETVIGVLEAAGKPMQAREIHAAAQELLGKPLLWRSVRSCLATNVGTRASRFERVGPGRYQRAINADHGGMPTSLR